MEVGLRKVGLAHGHFQVGMAQELLHRLEAHSLHYQVGGEGVTQVVEAEVLQPSLFASRGKGVLHFIKPLSPGHRTLRGI